MSRKKKQKVFRPVRLESLESDRKKGEPVFNREFSAAQKLSAKRARRHWEKVVLPGRKNSRAF